MEERRKMAPFCQVPQHVVYMSNDDVITKIIFLKMKKIVLAIVAVSISAMTMATQTAAFRVNLTSASSTTDLVKVFEDDTYTNAFENGVDADKMMVLANGYSVLMYGIVETHNCGTIGALNLDGMYLGFTTNLVDADYTLTFTNVSGREVKLYDAVADSVIIINASTPAYAFTATAGQVAVTDRFRFGDAPVIPYEICHRYNALQVSGYKGGTVVVKDNTDATVISVVVPTRTQHTIDLSALAAGQYKVEANGQTLIIDVK